MTEDAGRYVLVGVDGSPTSNAAVRWAALQARRLGHELLLLQLTIATCVAIRTVFRREHERIVGATDGARGDPG